MLCKSKDYQKICENFYRSVPACQGIEKKWSSLLASNISGEVCISDIFELAGVAVENKLIKFRSHGLCMYPSLKPKDILYIEPKAAQEIKVGDIAVFRRHNYLYGHRAIAKGEHNESAYILTRPDRSRQGNDGPSFNEDILGIVSSVERKGRIINLAEEKMASPKRRSFNFYLKRHHFKEKLFKKIIYVILYIQQVKIYKKIATFLWSKLQRKIDISIRAPLNFRMTSRFYQIISLEELRLLSFDMLKENAVPVRWSIVAHLNSYPAGLVSFIYKPTGCPFSGWWISEVNIRIRFRSRGIEEKLFQEIDGIFHQAGIKEIFVSFYEKRRLNKIIFSNLGFIETAAYNDKFHSVNRNRRVAPIVMRRQIL